MTDANPLDTLLSLAEFDAAARAVLTPMAYEYLAAGVADEFTLRANEAAFQQYRLRPRALVDVSRIDTRVRLFGEEFPFPILLAPAGYHQLFHPDGERATVAGANAADATLVASSFSTVAIEEMAALARRPLWFQLYVLPDREYTARLVRRAHTAGCQALVLTVDVPVQGVRHREIRSGFALPPGVSRANLLDLGEAIAAAAHRHRGPNIYSPVRDPALRWEDLPWLRSLTPLPLLLKGILTAEDAERALAAGVDGIVVSNHGGRSLDTLPATLDALPEVVQAVGGRVPVLMDSGIRRGTDVLKALALGATAVLIGRPYVFGLAVAGAPGVERVIELLRTEFESAMGMAGRPTLASIDRSVLWQVPEAVPANNKDTVTLGR